MPDTESAAVSVCSSSVTPTYSPENREHDDNIDIEDETSSILKIGIALQAVLNKRFLKYVEKN